MPKRAYYQAEISTFLASNQDQILGELASQHQFDLDILQRNAWMEQIVDLKQYLRDCRDGSIFLEFSIPRMGKRVDVLLVVKGVIFVVEYKSGAKTHDSVVLPSKTGHLI